MEPPAVAGHYIIDTHRSSYSHVRQNLSINYNSNQLLLLSCENRIPLSRHCLAFKRVHPVLNLLTYWVFIEK